MKKKKEEKHVKTLKAKIKKANDNLRASFVGLDHSSAIHYPPVGNFQERHACMKQLITPEEKTDLIPNGRVVLCREVTDEPSLSLKEELDHALAAASIHADEHREARKLLSERGEVLRETHKINVELNEKVMKLEAQLRSVGLKEIELRKLYEHVEKLEAQLREAEKFIHCFNVEKRPCLSCEACLWIKTQQELF